MYNETKFSENGVQMKMISLFQRKVELLKGWKSQAYR